MPDCIKLSTVLNELDDKLDSNGKQKTFSIKFDTKTGERIYLHRAVSVGLGYVNLKDKAMRGFLAVDKNNEKIGHHYPAIIWNIVEYNGMRVTLK